jgi:hypothetical protein
MASRRAADEERTQMNDDAAFAAAGKIAANEMLHWPASYI